MRHHRQIHKLQKDLLMWAALSVSNIRFYSHQVNCAAWWLHSVWYKYQYLTYISEVCARDTSTFVKEHSCRKFTKEEASQVQGERSIEKYTKSQMSNSNCRQKIAKIKSKFYWLLLTSYKLYSFYGCTFQRQTTERQMTESPWLSVKWQSVKFFLLS
jgi:hypothetical protein